MAPLITQALQGLPFNLITLSADVEPTTENMTWCETHPDESECQYGLYGYNITKSVQILALIAFVILWIITAANFASHSRGNCASDYTIAMVLGLTIELIGYACREYSADNQHSTSLFFAQHICLTMGPVFLSAAIYILLRRVVLCFDKFLRGPPGQVNPLGAETVDLVRDPPRPAKVRRKAIQLPHWCYTRLFITSDVVSFLLQATGGIMAASEYKLDGYMSTGNYIMLSGLALQAFTMLLVIFSSTLFIIRFYRYNPDDQIVPNGESRVIRVGPRSVDQVEYEEFRTAFRATRASRRYGYFMGCLGGATFCITIRCGFRVAEFSRGWRGPLRSKEGYFIIFETVMVVIAGICLVISNPSCTFRLLCPNTHGLSLYRFHAKVRRAISRNSSGRQGAGGDQSAHGPEGLATSDTEPPSRGNQPDSQKWRAFVEVITPRKWSRQSSTSVDPEGIQPQGPRQPQQAQQGKGSNTDIELQDIHRQSGSADIGN